MHTLQSDGLDTSLSDPPPTCLRRFSRCHLTVAWNPAEDHPISLTSASFAWSATQPALLHDITLQVPRGKLVIVIGPVGTGKSSLLAALLGEMCPVQGKVHVSGDIAYTS